MFSQAHVCEPPQPLTCHTGGGTVENMASSCCQLTCGREGCEAIREVGVKVVCVRGG